MDRSIIVDALRKKLEQLEYVYAMWLEGADATDTVDIYSDLDIWIDISDENELEAIEAVESALGELARIDYKFIKKHGHPKLRQRFYHLQGTSEYLMIDFCWQLHSRDKEEYVLIRDNKVEAAKVVFDKDNIIRYKKFDPSDYKINNINVIAECKYRYTQHARVMKYVYRNQFPEAYAYYNRYVVEPLIDVLRLIYTPAHTDYYLIHISSHIPQEDRLRLENFLKVSSLNDISANITKAEEWFEKLLVKLK